MPRYETDEDLANERAIADEVVASSLTIREAIKLPDHEVLDFMLKDEDGRIIGYAEAKKVRVGFGLLRPPMYGYAIPLRKVRKAEEHRQQSLPSYAWIRFSKVIRVASLNDWARDIAPYLFGPPNRPVSEWEPHVTIRWNKFT